MARVRWCLMAEQNPASPSIFCLLTCYLSKYCALCYRDLNISSCLRWLRIERDVRTSGALM